jgi:hypothetical protein
VFLLPCRRLRAALCRCGPACSHSRRTAPPPPQMPSPPLPHLICRYPVDLLSAQQRLFVCCCVLHNGRCIIALHIWSRQTDVTLHLTKYTTSVLIDTCIHAESQTVKQRCAELWSAYKAIAQMEWKKYAGERAAVLKGQLEVRRPPSTRVAFSICPVVMGSLIRAPRPLPSAV